MIFWVAMLCFKPTNQPTSNDRRRLALGTKQVQRWGLRRLLRRGRNQMRRWGLHRLLGLLRRRWAWGLRRLLRRRLEGKLAQAQDGNHHCGGLRRRAGTTGRCRGRAVVLRRAMCNKTMHRRELGHAHIHKSLKSYIPLPRIVNEPSRRTARLRSRI